MTRDPSHPHTPPWEGAEALVRKRRTLERRAHLTGELRAYFRREGFLEVETPSLTPWGTCEGYIDPFTTHLEDDRGQRLRAHFIPSPEISLKKLVAAGYGPVFELARVFRNREPLGGPQHNHQFSLLEWYEPGRTHLDLMDRLEALLEALCPGGRFRYQGRTFTTRGERLTVWDAFQKLAGLALPMPDHPHQPGAWDFLKDICEDRGHGRAETLDDAFYLLFLNEVEPRLREMTTPVFIYDYPAFQGAFAQLDGDGRFAARTEMYLAGMELANGYTELSDPDEQLKRFHEGNAIRRGRGMEEQPVDGRFLSALATLPPCAGMALGWDRLVMILSDAPSISDVLAFPDGDLFPSRNAPRG